MRRARLIYASTIPDSSYFSADLLWRIGMRIHDPHFFIEFSDTPGSGVLLAGSLEINRAKKEAKNADVVSADEFREFGAATAFGALGAFLKSRSVQEFEFHPDTPVEIVEKLRDRFSVSVGSRPWYPSRIEKTADEIRWIRESIRAAEDALGYIRERIAKSVVRENALYDGARPIASEELRSDIERDFFLRGFDASGSILSCGAAAAHPHETGEGPLLPRSAIVCDLFPRSRATGYFADITRTFFKGAPAQSVARAYEAVFQAQKIGIEMVRADADGTDIHSAVARVFEHAGYKTDYASGEGFIHSTGHGVGLECHELPSVGERSSTLPEHAVLTVEPGLYYPSEGFGIRIEDMVLVGKNSALLLTSFPREFASAVVD